MLNINETFLDRRSLVWEWLLDWNANDTSGNWNDGTASNVTWVNTDRGYVEEFGESNWTSTRIQTDAVLQDWYTISYWTEMVNLTENQCRVWDADRSASNQQLTCYYRVAESWFTIGSQTASWFEEVVVAPISEVWTYHVVAYFKNWDWELTVNNTTYTSSVTWPSPTWLDGLTIFASSDTTPSYDPWKIWLVRMYNRKLSQQEIRVLYQEWLRKFWPTHLLDRSQWFPKYSLLNLEKGKVLEISQAQSWGSYIDQTGNWNNWTPINVTDTSLWLNNVMSFNWTNSIIDIWKQIVSWLTNASVFTNVSVDSFSNNGQAYVWEYNQSWDRVFVLDTVNSNNFRLIVSDSSNSTIVLTTSSWDYQTNKWYNVWFTYNNWDVRFYVDWVEVLSDTISLSWPLDTTTENFVIWARDNDGTEHFDWSISSVEAWNKTLSEIEIQQDYYSNKLI